MEKIVTLSTNRSEYNILGAAKNSITVAEFIEELSHLDSSLKIVFSNDGGYTYGYIKANCIDTEYVDTEEDEEPEDDCLTREDMIAELKAYVKEKNKGEYGTVEAHALWVGDDDVLLIGYDDDRQFGIWVGRDENPFIPIEDMSDELVDEVWYETTQVK